MLMPYLVLLASLVLSGLLLRGAGPLASGVAVAVSLVLYWWTANRYRKTE